MGNDFWAIQRGYYSSISSLVTKVDDAVSIITAFSLSNNLYYILIQLLHSFQYGISIMEKSAAIYLNNNFMPFYICRPQGTILENIYFWFSLVFLVGRTVFMSLFAARINDESKKPAVYVRAIPNENYNVEVRVINVL